MTSTVFSKLLKVTFKVWQVGLPAGRQVSLYMILTNIIMLVKKKNYKKKKARGKSNLVSYLAMIAILVANRPLP